MPKYKNIDRRVMRNRDKLFNKLYDIFNKKSTQDLSSLVKLMGTFIEDRGKIKLSDIINCTDHEEALGLIKKFDLQLGNFKVKYRSILEHYPLIDRYVAPFTDYLDDRNMDFMRHAIYDIIKDRFEKGSLMDVNPKKQN